MTAPSLREIYAEGLLMWYDLCPPCEAAFYAWRDAPNPGAWTNPKIQGNPALLGFLGACRAAGPSPERWRETVSSQLLLIRRICTDRHNAHNLDYGYPDGFPPPDS